MSSSELLEVERLCVAWDGLPVLREVSFTIREGEFVVLMGPNGSGKTTLLRTLAGFERALSGSATLGGRTLLDLPAHRRDVGILFQEPALFPDRSVAENVAYGPEVARLPAAEVERRVRDALALLRIAPFASRRPDELSGGERQRVALARTLAREPSLVLLDEPFASVDREIRADLQAEFREALARRGIAALHVTHDREEGLFLGDRVLLLVAGRLVQSGSPEEVYRRPRTAAAARFLGYNVLHDGRNALAVHPREMRIEPGPGGPRGLSGTVMAAGFAGDEGVVHVRLASGERVEVRPPPGSVLPRVGGEVALAWGRGVPLEPDEAPGAAPGVTNREK